MAGGEVRQGQGESVSYLAPNPPGPDWSTHFTAMEKAMKKASDLMTDHQYDAAVDHLGTIQDRVNDICHWIIHRQAQEQINDACRCSRSLCTATV